MTFEGSQRRPRRRDAAGTSRSEPQHISEALEQLRADLARNHPDLSEADLDRILTGEPARRRARSPQAYRTDGIKGKSQSRYETPSAGRRTSRPSPSVNDGRDNR